MSGTDLRIRLGQRLGVGFDGPVIPDEFVRLVKEYKVGNVILFKRNVHSREQLTKLCADLRQLIRAETGFEPFIMIDEECGSVSRLGHIAGETPSAMAIGATGDPENARTVGRIVGERLRAVGVNLDLAPVLDCFTNQDNTVCGNRCFSSDPETVGRFGVAYTEGLQSTGVLACGKHFPGHGDTAVDSHLALPTIRKPMEAIRETELKPFEAAIRGGIASIMTTHILFPALDPEVPATVSRRIMTGLLREELGFEGLIVSDAIEMKAVLNLFGIPDGTLRALNAGVDIALICHSPADGAAAMEYLESAVRDGRLSDENIQAGYQRVVGRKKLLPETTASAEGFGTPEQQAAAERIMEAGIRLLHAPEGQALPAIGAWTAVFGTKGRRNALVNDDIVFDAARAFTEAYGGRYMEQPPEDAPDTALVFIGRHPDADQTVNAAIRLAERGTKVIAVSLFTPTCLRPLPDSVWKIAAWQYDSLAVRALAGWLAKKFRRTD